MGAKNSPVRDEEGVFAGEDVVLLFTVKDKNGNVVNITGFSIDFLFREDENTANLFTKATGGSGITITDGVGGKYQVAIDSADWLALAAGRKFFKTRRTDSGFLRSMAFGTFALRAA